MSDRLLSDCRVIEDYRPIKVIIVHRNSTQGLLDRLQCN